MPVRIAVHVVQFALQQLGPCDSCHACFAYTRLTTVVMAVLYYRSCQMSGALSVDVVCLAVCWCVFCVEFK